jgi:hypothetical protein
MTMNTEPVTKPKRSRLIRCLRWLGLGLALIVTAVALFYAVENFRGKRAWESYRKSAEQRGLVLDFAAHSPPQIPTEQNAVDIPLVNAWFDPRMRPKGDPTLWPDLFERAQGAIASDRDKTKRRMTDLVAWQEAFAAAEANDKKAKVSRRSRTPQELAAAGTNVLAALRVYDPALDQLREGMKRPQVRYPVDYNVETPFSILIPHVQNIRGICSLLALRASANLATGNSEAASQDVLLSLRVVESLRNEHFLISYLIQIACLQTATQPLWEGMVQQRWTDPQLQALQQQAARFDFLKTLQHAFDTERAACITTIDWIKQAKSGQRYNLLGEPAGAIAETSLNVATFVPRGWWEMEKVSYGNMFERITGPLSAALESGTFANAEDPLPEKPARQGFSAVWNHELMSSLLLPALDKVQRKAGMGQALADEMVVACALERARVAEGRYPQSLTALTPKFLPQPRRDVMTGQPLIYRTESGGYVLYSVGWNRRDDGGAPGKVLFDEQNGDWTWRVQAEGPREFE